MELSFWGTRAGYPLPGPSTVRFGGNTPCLSLRAGGSLLILDAGTGARPLGRSLFAESFGKGQGEAHWLLSCLRWEHTQGFPFCGPIFVPKNRFHIYGPTSPSEAPDAPSLSQVFREYLTHEPYFPVALAQMGGQFSFSDLRDQEAVNVGAFEVLPVALPRPWRVFGFRAQAEGADMAYIPDTAAWCEAPARHRLTEGAGVAVFEFAGALRNLPEVLRCGAARVLLSFFPPDADDDSLTQSLESLRQIPDPLACPVDLAREGLRLSIG